MRNATRYDGKIMRALIPRDQYEALSHSVYLNQASLGLIPRDSVEAMTAFLQDVARHGQRANV